MSFWDLDDGSSAISEDKEYSAGGGYDEPLPKGTSVLVIIEDAAWKEAYQRSETFVNLKVRVLKPEGYANRVLYFKLWIDELDPSAADQTKAKAKRDKHKKMLMALDANAKGKLAKLQARPTDDQLAVALVGAQFVAVLGVWDKTDAVTGAKSLGGNWLMTARPKSAEVSEGPAARKASPKRAVFDDDDLDDDVPF